MARYGRDRSNQYGQAMILTVVLISVGLFAVILSSVRDFSITATNRQVSDVQATFAEVRQALVLWSARRNTTDDGVNARPGELPCPDTDNDGFENGSCAAGALGRVPWKTLGIAEPKDDAGETLWYTLAGNFRIYNMSSAPITSNTQGNITVYQESTAVALTTQAVAVLFAPGIALGTQIRESAANKNTASNYLDLHSPSGVNNATTNGPFISTVNKADVSFNDKLMVITNADLMPMVEPFVAAQVMSYLERYRLATGFYPWADLADGNSNGTPYDNAYNRNRFPCLTASPTTWAAAGITLPVWLTNGCATLTGWASVIFYAVAKNRLQDSGAGCTPTCSAATTLTITNSGTATLCQTGVTPFRCTPQQVSSGSADLVLMTPGAYTGSPTRNWPTSFTSISGYFEDPENYDNTDDNYSIPSSTAANRDRVYIVR